MLQAAQSLIPILLLVTLGAVLFWRRFITPEFRDGMDRFTYWVALPSLFVQRLADTDFQALQAGNMVIVLAITFVAASLIAAVVAAILRLPRDEFGVFVQVGFRGNMAFVGLPLIIFAVGGAGDDILVASALIALAAMVPLSNLIAVLALITARSGLSFSMLGPLVVKVVTNPLIISAVIGGLIGYFGGSLPTIIDSPLELLGQTALALALVSLGGALVQLEFRHHLGLAILSSLFKIGVMPAVAFALTRLWELGPDQTFVVMVLCACPAATASYILTTQLGGDESLAAAGIVVSTVLSFVSLGIVVALF